MSLLNDKALDSGLELTIHIEDENHRLSSVGYQGEIFGACFGGSTH